MSPNEVKVLKHRCEIEAGEAVRKIVKDFEHKSGREIGRVNLTYIADRKSPEGSHVIFQFALET